jgi:cbb3-type cytochrome oxidase subunit 1
MHSLVRRYIKTAIGFLIVGLLIGGWMMIRREIWQQFPSRWETSAHTHAIFSGFVMMMILGVALWLFPRPDRSDRSYRPALVNAAWWLLTIGTGYRIVGELLRAGSNAEWLRWSVALSGVLQIAGFVLFFATMWRRIRAVGSQQREASGERF